MNARTTLGLGSSLAALLVLAQAGCRQQQQRDIPNRVLDRPTDVALVCVDTECVEENGEDVCTIVPVPLNVCAQDSTTCGSDNPHLVGFVANSERNEIAMFTKCSDRLVDMNVDVPGYNFIPAGLLPTDLATSVDGCRVVSTNVGSCDLTVLDAPRLASFGLGEAATLGSSDVVDEPSSLVSTLIPRTLDPVLGSFRPLGARPGQVVAVPASLTQAPGLDPDATLEGVCDPQVRRSVYVSFPTCNLVAEIDLQTGNIVQSRQFVSDGLGGVEVVDTGVSPECPVECPVQFEGELPDPIAIDEDGPFVQALELSLEPTLPSEDPDPNGASTTIEYDAADEAMDGQRLFVGGLGSDILFEIPITDSGLWDSFDNQLALSQAGGIKGIRASGGVNAPVEQEDFAQFLYIVAGDGSTRVVGRSLPAPDDSIGIECETQLDPTVFVEASACIEVTQGPTDGQPASRRGFSRGPGIRAPFGAEVTDWMFRKTYADSEGKAVNPTGGPFAEPGTVAVGVTTGGTAIYTMINQERASGTTTVSTLSGVADPANVMDVRLFPHSLWPAVNPDDSLAPLPLVQDATSQPFIPTGAGPTRVLAPSLRLIDAAYYTDDRARLQLGVEANSDQLGDDEDAQRLYEEDVVRVAVHDYRSWGDSGGQSWTLEWEGAIPNTRSSTGRIDCDKPGWEGGTCLVGPGPENKSKLLDSGANFCDDGVLPGDKLVILGCREDDDCGDGRRCLRESAGGQSSGICISEQAYDERASELRQICADFISDPCGEALREYTIVEAFQDELWLQSMDTPIRSSLLESDDIEGCSDGANNFVDPSATDGCSCLPGFSEEACGPGNVDNECCADTSVLLPGQAPVYEAEARWTCTEDQPEGGCESDDECEVEGASCVDARCRVPCVEGEDCILRRLPGPACFNEFVSYQVHLRNAFRVSGPGLNFITSLVEVRSELLEGEDEAREVCRPTSDAELSRLLTSRLPLPPSDDPDDPDWLAIPACVGDTVEPSNANPCRVVASREGDGATTLFHTFEYEDRVTVSALRYSNPILSIVLDLSSLGALSSAVPDYEEDSVWPIDFARFRRSRIPRGYRQSFGLESGYSAFSDVVTLEGRPMTYPVRIVAGAQSDVAYIVDGSGPGSSTSIRGQVLRVNLGEQVLSDETFTGVR